MALVLKNRVKSTTTTTGTGSITLGSAAAGYQDFSVIGNNNETYYLIKGSTEWEVGRGTYLLGWSVGFDGDLDYLDVSSNSAFTIGTSDFTLEGYMYVVSGTTGTLYDSRTGLTTVSPVIYLNSGVLTYFVTNNRITGPTLNAGKWYHIAVSRSGTDTRMFVDGVQVGTTYTDNNDYVVGAPKIGAGYLNGNLLNGYISNLRLVIGSALYTSTFTPPNSALTAITNTRLLICQSPSFIDNSTTSATITTFGNASISKLNPISSSANAELLRETIFSSSNSGDLVNFSAGSKDVLCVYPSAAMSGGVPYADDNDVGADLSGWRMFKAALNNGVAADVTFNNSGAAGIVSTYSLVYTTTNAYQGGVLDPGGAIHFVPSGAARGQKISLSGVVSTYALVYTAATNNYFGGVLAPNGDIHFVPSNAAVGQKVSASGLVSTYSLVYTTTNAYHGGVLAPNGDIHFVPSSADRGQKVNSSGVVSTYSLAYTTASAYEGAVLAPNGEIHFVPLSASVGQKISTSGIVSTYSLVYTVANAYSGGVLAPNGDIHFVPYSAVQGQKLSADGVVSTYSLVYTTTAAYLGGVLAPSGDIHFVPTSANRGQKISTSGTVSTYSLVYTGASFIGGVLTPRGDIHFIVQSAVRGQVVSVNSGSPLGTGVCLSPFLNKL